jgi:hypothetical protein
MSLEAIYEKQSIFLVSGNHTVRLCVEDYIKTHSVHPAQLLLKTDGLLQVGKRYELYVLGLAPPLTQYPYQYQLAKSWMVSNNIDTTAPRFLQKPVEIDKFWNNSCPRVCIVRFCPNIKEASIYLAKAKLTDPFQNWSTSYYEIPYKSSITVGGNECSSFICNMLGKPFVVEFSLIDVFGNYSADNSGPIAFTMPAKGDVRKIMDRRDFKCP